MPRELFPHLVDADLLVIAPLSANTLAKLAHGQADNVLTQTALAFDGPVLVAPAMNPRMWGHPATRRNVETLRAPRSRARRPEHGDTAEGEAGVGRMSEPEDDLRARSGAAGEARAAPVSGVLVTAGGTREPLDAVRFLGNRSSGRMGTALAAEAKRRGAEVTLVACEPLGACARRSGRGLRADRRGVARETLARGDADVVLMAAAVADYRPAEPEAGKRPKDATTGR